MENVKNDEIEVYVVAAMSAGKSTLINSMLQTKLMPSRWEGWCTAIITRIKDKDGTDWSAEVYNNENKIIETCKELNYETMNRLNADERVSTIKISGDIPFVTSEDISLVLIDTPVWVMQEIRNTEKFRRHFWIRHQKRWYCMLWTKYLALRMMIRY